MQTCMARYKGVLFMEKRRKGDKTPLMITTVLAMMQKAEMEKRPQNGGDSRQSGR